MPYITIGPRNEYEMFIDDEDLILISQYKWFYDSRRSIRCTKTHQQLPRMLMDCPSGMVVDHIDGNLFNNSRSNLRVCTPQQNNTNIPGENAIRRGNRWGARVGQLWLGTYDTKEEAQRIADAKKQELYGVYARKRETSERE